MEPRQPSLLARAIVSWLKAGFNFTGGAEVARREGAPAEVSRWLTRSAIAATSESQGGWTTDEGLTAAFIASPSVRSFFLKMLVRGAWRPCQLRQQLGIVGSGPTAVEVAESMPIPASTMALSLVTVAPTKAAGLLVASDTLATNRNAARIIDREVGSAIGKAADAIALDILTTGISATASAGITPLNAITDLATLLAGLPADDADPYFIVGPDVARGALTLADSEGRQTFADMSLQGGLMLGIPTLVSAAMPAATIVAVDAAGVCADADAVRIEPTSHGTVEMSDAPGQDPSAGTGATQVSLWQAHLIGIRGVIAMALMPVRDSVCAKITGVGWAAGAAS